MHTIRGNKCLWRLEQPMPADVREALNGMSPMLCHLLYYRGYRTVAEIEAFFSQGAVSHDPFLLTDMGEAVERITRAIEGGERVAVYGDFDCDGVTSAAVLVATLRGCGIEPIAHIPTRADGHGLHPEALAALADASVELVITADCGITAIEEVQVARGMGMEVIVTDHHEARADGSLPDCPTVCPTRHDSEYPCRFLCGVGVVYKLAQALSGRVPAAPDPEEVLDLVALGTVADVVQMRDENRSLVIRGLKRLQATQRPGLLALFRAAGVDPRRIDPISIGFYLAPRINAANRMASPQLAYDLITATDDDVADQLAAQLSTYNQQRQDLVAEKIAKIAEEIGDPSRITVEVLEGRRPPLLLLTGDWPVGISGLLASKLVDIYGLPAFVGSDAGDGIVSVSARSIPGVHIDEILEGCESSLPGGLFLGYGGHSGAGGFRVHQEHFPLARSALEQETSRQVRLEEVGAVLQIDAEVSLAALSVQSAQQLRSLAPFGSGFPEPLFLVRNVTLLRRSVVGDGKHARFTLQRGETCVDGVSFHAEPSFLELPLESKLDTVLHLQLNEWNGLVKPEMRLRDWRLSE